MYMYFFSLDGMQLNSTTVISANYIIQKISVQITSEVKSYSTYKIKDYAWGSIIWQEHIKIKNEWWSKFVSNGKL